MDPEEGTRSSNDQRKQSKKKRKDKVCFYCESVGHLAKFCPNKETKVQSEEGSQLPDKDELIFTPAKRIRFKTKEDLDSFTNRIHSFKFQSRKQQTLQPNLYKPIMKETIAYLVWKYGSRKDLMCSPSKIVLAFCTYLSSSTSSDSQDHKFGIAGTSIMTGYITFSTKVLEKEITDQTESGYDLEQPWVDRWCKNKKEEYLFWIVFHEFTHLFAGCNHDRHDKPFFLVVEKFVEENTFFFE